jgi:aryl-alcohol dehydrogenase-like predicted oxidoreductase
MERRRLGRTGLQVSTLGFGASEIGYQGIARATVSKLLNSALDAGLNLIDTAACYANSEELLGVAIGARRGECHLMTKCGHSTGLPFAEWTPELITASIAQSLRRLRTDYLDVIQFHSCEARAMRNDDLMGALVRAREAGHARFLGYSGDGADALYAIETGIFDTLQISINLADQEAIDLVLPKAIEREIGVIAKRPLANAAWTLSRWHIGSYERPYLNRLRKLKYDFLRGGSNNAVSTALRFTLSVPGVHRRLLAPPSRDAGKRMHSYWRRGRSPPATSPQSASAGQKSRAPTGLASAEPGESPFLTPLITRAADS